jgi:hypothetical protein
LFRQSIVGFTWVLLITGISVAQPPIKENLSLSEIRMHDPWILADKETQTYYMYAGAGPQVSERHRAGVIAYKSRDLKIWSGPYTVFEVPERSWADPTASVWAPEVHRYGGKYYLFATLHNYKPPSSVSPSTSDGKTHIEVAYNGIGPHPRGTQVFVSDSPSGPFKEISDKPIPPFDYMSLDGTLYVEDGKPYMIYAHEWIQLIDGNMEAIEMSPDLTSAVGPPFFLFKASDAPWLDDRHTTVNKPMVYVTDGPELYQTRTGKLLMLWSSYKNGSYVETLAYSLTGKLAGPWKQDRVLVGDDSGHGMLFRTFDGRLMLVLHHPFDGRLSRAKLYEMEDIGDTIRLKQ